MIVRNLTIVIRIVEANFFIKITGIFFTLNVISDGSGIIVRFIILGFKNSRDKSRMNINQGGLSIKLISHFEDRSENNDNKTKYCLFK